MKVKKSRYKLCGVTPHFSTGQNHPISFSLSDSILILTFSSPWKSADTFYLCDI